jgi:hypothetical protein
MPGLVPGILIQAVSPDCGLQARGYIAAARWRPAFANAPARIARGAERRQAPWAFARRACEARHTLARRVESPARRPSPLGAPPRRFREAAEAVPTDLGPRLRTKAEAFTVQPAPGTRVVVPVGRGAEASRGFSQLSRTRRRRPCFCQSAPPVGAPEQAGYGNIIPKNMVLSRSARSVDSDNGHVRRI